MTRIYTTQELSQILVQEREACLRGDRLNLTAATQFNPVIDPFLNREGIQKFRAFCDFQSAIHQYQQDHQISGLLWKTLTIQDRTIEYPELDEYLAALPTDLLTLNNYKSILVHFWCEVTQSMDRYLQMDKHTPPQSITESEIQARAERSEWAALHQLTYGDTFELTLQLGWGNPREALYQKYWPTAGCYFIHGVETGQRPRSAYY